MANFVLKSTETVTVTVEAENEEEALFWAQTHSIADIQRLTSAYDIQFQEEVVGETDEAAAFSI